MASTLRSTRKPIGIQVYKPDALAVISPARSMSLWLASTASAGASLRVEMKNWLAFMGVSCAIKRKGRIIAKSLALRGVEAA